MPQVRQLSTLASVGAYRILLVSPGPDDLDDVRVVVVCAGYDCSWAPIDDTRDVQAAATDADLVVIDGSLCERQALDVCRHLQGDPQEWFRPLVYVTTNPAPALKVGSFEMGADAHLTRPFDTVDLIARVKSLLRIKSLQDRLAEQNRQIARINRQLRLAQQRIEEELKLAQRLQQGFLPKDLPDVGPISFAVKYDLCGHVGGDCYDVFRLDENHVGFYIADAIGHGVPAALLTVFVKKGIRTKQINGNSYRIIPPEEVVARLNHDMIAHDMSENPFITMIYGIVDAETLLMTYARAGHPYPIRLRPGSLEALLGEGPLLGVFDSEFTAHRVQLQPGDKVLLYTDGIDLVSYGGAPEGMDSFLACAEDLAHLPADRFVAELHTQLFTTDDGPIDAEDDVTLLCLEVARQRKDEVRRMQDERG